jgi:hypothetical protein
MKTSESIAKIAPALLVAQKKLKNVKQTAENPFYNSTYAPLNEILAEVRPIYNEAGITIMHDIENSCISVILLHESGEWIKQEGFFLPLDKQTPQGAGSALTYGRRYTLSAMLGIASDEDDDGNKSEKQKTPQPKKDDYILDNENAPSREIYAEWKAAGTAGNYGKWHKNDSGSWDWYKLKKNEAAK